MTEWENAAGGAVTVVVAAFEKAGSVASSTRYSVALAESGQLIEYPAPLATVAGGAVSCGTAGVVQFWDGAVTVTFEVADMPPSAGGSVAVMTADPTALPVTTTLAVF